MYIIYIDLCINNDLSKKLYDEKSAPDKILREITIAGEDGIFQKDLLNNIHSPVDRTTVYRVTKKYEKDGKIRIITKGRRTKYVIVKKAIALSDMSAYLLGRNFAFHLLHEDNVILCDGKTLLEKIDVTSYKQFFEPKFATESFFIKNRQPEKSLFEFSNRVGAFIVYILIQVMNPDNRRMIGYLKNKHDNSGKKVLDESNTDVRVKKWTIDSITTVLPYLLWDFRVSIHKSLGLYPKNLDEEVEYFWRPELIFIRESARKAKSAFARLYPYLNYKLDKFIEEELPVHKRGHL